MTIIRKNAASMTPDEWAAYMGGCAKLKHTFAPGSSISIYDSFVAIHVAVTRLTGAQTRDGAHRAPGFLPWHREYLRRFELALRVVEPEAFIPYWNWGAGPDTDTTSLFTEGRVGTMGAGGANQFEIETGYLARNGNAFNPMGWEVHPALRPFGGTLQRNSSLNMGPGFPTAQSVSNALGQSNFSGFFSDTESMHNTIHGRVGRDMARMTSPNDPIFFMHHAQVDRLWAIWQKDHPGSANFNPLNTGGQGHRVNDWMWPWDGGASQTTATTTNGSPLTDLLPTFAATDVVRPLDVLDIDLLHYAYEEYSVEEPTTLAIGEEGPVLTWNEDGEPEVFTTFLRGEENSDGPDLTTLALGEEGDPVTTLALGEEGQPPVTTLAIGEEGGPITWVEDGGPIPRPPRPFPRPFPGRRRGPFGR